MTIDDRIRAATQAVAATVREVAPLELPPAAAVARPRRRRSRRGSRPGAPSRPARPARPERPARADGPGGDWWAGLLIPVAAAVAVIAVAAILVAVRAVPADRPASRATPAPVVTAFLQPAGAPRYAAFVNEGANDRHSDLSVVDTETGRTLATFTPPAHGQFTGVAGAADDRTFVLDEAPLSAYWTQTATHSFYLLRLTPGGPHPATLTRLPIRAPFVFENIRGLALSPDGQTLAVLAWPNPGGRPATASYLRTWSVATGQDLRSWNGPAPLPADGVIATSYTADNVAGLSWLANGRELAFTYPGQALRVLDITRNVTGLLTGSRLVFTLPAAGARCVQALLTPDGRTVLCLAEPSNTGCLKTALEVDAYSAATGKLEHALYRDAGNCLDADAQLLWAGSGTTAVIQLQTIDAPTTPPSLVITRIVGALTPGKLAPLHFPPVPLGSGPGLIAF